MPSVSLGTIYRNLKTLTEMGEILELSYGSTYSRFDGNAHNHYHFVCEQCGKVIDIDMPELNDLETAVEKKTGARVNKHRLEFYGTCEDCIKAQRKNSAAN